MKFILLPLSLIFLALNFINYNIVEDNNKIEINEKFDPSLTRLNSLSKLEVFVDSIALTENILPGTLDYAILAKDVVAFRFYHKYSTQNLNENWIASVTQKITGLYLSSNITADDILSKPYGYCGQQNSVLMELLQTKNLNCRAVYLPHHFVIQCQINGEWYYFDPDQEPEIPPAKRADLSWLHNKDSLEVAYGKDKQWIENTFGDPVNFKYGKINEVQGPHAQIFQAITKVLSRIAFLFPLLLFFYLNKKQNGQH